MQRKDLYLMGVLWALVLLTFYPVFYADYIFMDEALQVWNYKSGTSFFMFKGNGRWLTEWLMRGLFERVDTIHEIRYIRMISLFGWLVCLPVWYVVVQQLVVKRKELAWLPFFVCLLLVTGLPFIVSVQWASCVEFFIAYTMGLLSGAVFLKGIYFNGNKLRIPVLHATVALVLGLASLLFYQVGFGCFLIPCLLIYILMPGRQKDRVLIAAFAFHFLVYFVYFLVHKLALQLDHIQADGRTTLYFDVIGKIKFFLARPLERAFRFNILIDEDSIIGGIYYKLMLMAWVVLAFVRFKRSNWLGAIKYLAACLLVFLTIYLPLLIVKENFASNRTLLALDVAVFVVCFEMAMYFIKNRRGLKMAGMAITVVSAVSARYNFQKVFLPPTQQETAALKSYIQKNYHAGVRTIYFIRPSGDLISEKYHIPQSMDEFGVAYSSWNWVPDPLTRQMVYEATGNRAMAAQLVVKQWPDMQSYRQSGAVVTAQTLVIDVPAILNAVQP